jgi:poly-gamma-glutamate synthesis protein (capsule biosynthesis protein)
MRRTATIFLSGDVMTGRGIDQILPCPSMPQLFEPSVDSATTYVELAERATGPIPRPVGFDYVWGDVPAEFDRLRPDARIVNLETAITTSNDASPQKSIHYRMHPSNIECLAAVKLDCCVLANNHCMDWGRSGLAETLTSLQLSGIRTAGAGANALTARAPAAIAVDGQARLLVFSFCSEDSGVPRDWAATANRSGVNLLADLSTNSADTAAHQIASQSSSADLVIASIHWGGNWGYEVSERQREFAHRLIDTAGVDLVHGHSSHHAKGIEIYKRKAILYGCGDLLNDYEGIRGYESFRGDLGLMYFATLDADSGDLVHLAMTPTQMRRMRVRRASSADLTWLKMTMHRECQKHATDVIAHADGTLRLKWPAAMRLPHDDTNQRS